MTLRLKALLAAATVSVGLWVAIIAAGTWLYESSVDTTFTASVR
ncbi:hypothetical protein EV130_12043 [Rhizobium azibense]|uniref:Uncharacterized protein n=1 Tax=Rhizobium azibense TaxID=1136135 RepID=A0A4R3RAZ4_9HYPH|nr:hypothetical protein EV130_12043 [Rhizobium azibense]TCU31417.1 hypothetical protein EV129_12843 [Rhizobium azibense]